MTLMEPLVVKCSLPSLTTEKLRTCVGTILDDFPDKIVLVINAQNLSIYTGFADICTTYLRNHKLESGNPEFLKTYLQQRTSFVIKSSQEKIIEIDSYSSPAIAGQVKALSKERHFRKVRAKLDPVTYKLQGIDQTLNKAVPLGSNVTTNDKQNKGEDIKFSNTSSVSLEKAEDEDGARLKLNELEENDNIENEPYFSVNKNIHLKHKSLPPREKQTQILSDTSWTEATPRQVEVKSYPVKQTSTHKPARRRRGRRPLSHASSEMSTKTHCTEGAMANTKDELKYPIQETQPHNEAVDDKPAEIGSDDDNSYQITEPDACSLKTELEGACGYTPDDTAQGAYQGYSYAHDEGRKENINSENEVDSVSVIKQATEDIPPSSLSDQSATNDNFIGQPKYAVYADEPARKATYIHWPAKLIQDPDRLAEKGFFYTGTGDLARCFSCGLGLKGWESDDDPFVEHVNHTRGCLFLTNLLGSDELDKLKQRLQGYVPLQTSNPEQTKNEETRPVEQYNLPFVPRHQNFISQSVRESSFARWPADHPQTPKQLAEAGFFYTGVEDICRCYGCDGGLRRWDPQDEPWIEHAKWFPHCPHILHVKGVDFVERVRWLMESSEEENKVLELGTDIMIGNGICSTIINLSCDTDIKDLPQAPLDFVTRSMNQISMQSNSSVGQENRERKTKVDEVSPAVQSVQEMGYSRKAIQLCMQELRDRGSNETSTGSIREEIGGDRRGRKKWELRTEGKEWRAVRQKACLGENWEVKIPFSGTKYPRAEEIIQELIDKEERGEILPVDSPPRSPILSTDSDTDDPEVLYNENQRLKSLLICVVCDVRERNVLTLPCTHHKMCQQCAQTVTSCPECQRPIKQKIKTYMS